MEGETGPRFQLSLTATTGRPDCITERGESTIRCKEKDSERQANGIEDDLAYRQERYNQLLALIEAQRFREGLPDERQQNKENLRFLMNKPRHMEEQSWKMDILAADDDTKPIDPPEEFCSDDDSDAKMKPDYDVTDEIDDKATFIANQCSPKLATKHDLSVESDNTIGRTVCQPQTEPLVWTIRSGDVITIKPDPSRSEFMVAPQPAPRPLSVSVSTSTEHLSDDSPVTVPENLRGSKLVVQPPVEVTAGIHCEKRQKRHVIEEIVVEDCEKFYEEQPQPSTLLRIMRRPAQVATVEWVQTKRKVPAQSVSAKPVEVASDRGDEGRVDSPTNLTTETDSPDRSSPSVQTVTYVLHCQLQPQEGGQTVPERQAKTAPTTMTSQPVSVGVEDDESVPPYVQYRTVGKTMQKETQFVLLSDAGGKKEQSEQDEALINAVTYIVQQDFATRLSTAEARARRLRTKAQRNRRRRRRQAALLSANNPVTYVVHYDVPITKASPVPLQQQQQQQQVIDIPILESPPASGTRGLRKSPAEYEYECKAAFDENDLQTAPVATAAAAAEITKAPEIFTRSIDYEVTAHKQVVEKVQSSPVIVVPPAYSLETADTLELPSRRSQHIEEDSISEPWTRATGAAAVADVPTSPSSDIETMTYVIQYDITKRRRRKPPKRRRKTEPTAGATWVVEDVAAEDDVGCELPEAHTAARTSLPAVGTAERKRFDAARVRFENPLTAAPKRDPDETVTYTIKYEVLPRQRRILGKRKHRRPVATASGSEPAFRTSPVREERSITPPVSHPSKTIAIGEAHEGTVTYNLQQRSGPPIAEHDDDIISPVGGGPVEVKYVVDYEIKKMRRKIRTSMSKRTRSKDAATVELTDEPRVANIPSRGETIAQRVDVSREASAPITESVARRAADVQEIKYVVEYETVKRVRKRQKPRISKKRVTGESADLPRQKVQAEVPTTGMQSVIASEEEQSARALVLSVSPKLDELDSTRSVTVSKDTEQSFAVIPTVEAAATPGINDEIVKYVVEYNIVKRRRKKQQPRSRGAAAAKAVSAELKNVRVEPAAAFDVSSVVTSEDYPTAVSTYSSIQPTVTLSASYTDRRVIVSSQNDGAEQLRSTDFPTVDAAEAPEVDDETIRYVVEYDIVKRRRKKQKPRASRARGAAAAAVSPIPDTELKSASIEPAAVIGISSAGTSQELQLTEQRLAVIPKFEAAVTPESNAETIRYDVEYNIVKRKRKKQKSRVQRMRGADVSPIPDTELQSASHGAGAIEISSARSREEQPMSVAMKTFGPPSVETDVANTDRQLLASDSIEHRGYVIPAVEDAAGSPEGAVEETRYIVEYEIVKRRRKQRNAMSKTRSARSPPEVSQKCLPIVTSSSVNAADLQQSAAVVAPDSVQLQVASLDTSDSSPDVQLNEVRYVVEYEVIKRKRRKPQLHVKKATVATTPAVEADNLDQKTTNRVENWLEIADEENVQCVMVAPAALAPSQILTGLDEHVLAASGKNDNFAVKADEFKLTVDRVDFTAPPELFSFEHIKEDENLTEAVTFSADYDVPTVERELEFQMKEIQYPGTSESVAYCVDYDISLQPTAVAAASELQVAATADEAEILDELSAPDVDKFEAVKLRDEKIEPAGSAVIEIVPIEEPSSTTETFIYEVEYEIVRKKLKKAKRQRKKPKSTSEILPSVTAGTKDVTELRASSSDKNVDVVEHVAATSQAPSSGTGAEHRSEMILCAVEYEIAAKKLKKRAKLPRSRLRTSKSKEISIEDQEKHISDVASDAPNSMTYVIEYDVIKKRADKLGKNAAQAASAEPTQERSADTKTDLPCMESVDLNISQEQSTYATPPSLQAALPSSVDGPLQDSVTYTVEYDIAIRKRRKQPRARKLKSSGGSFQKEREVEKAVSESVTTHTVEYEIAKKPKDKAKKAPSTTPSCLKSGGEIELPTVRQQVPTVTVTYHDDDETVTVEAQPLESTDISPVSAVCVHQIETDSQAREPAISDVDNVDSKTGDALPETVTYTVEYEISVKSLPRPKRKLKTKPVSRPETLPEFEGGSAVPADSVTYTVEYAIANTAAVKHENEAVAINFEAKPEIRPLTVTAASEQTLSETPETVTHAIEREIILNKEDKIELPQLSSTSSFEYNLQPSVQTRAIEDDFMATQEVDGGALIWIPSETTEEPIVEVTAPAADLKTQPIESVASAEIPSESITYTVEYEISLKKLRNSIPKAKSKAKSSSGAKQAKEDQPRLETGASESVTYVVDYEVARIKKSERTKSESARTGKTDEETEKRDAPDVTVTVDSQAERVAEISAVVQPTPVAQEKPDDVDIAVDLNKPEVEHVELVSRAEHEAPAVAANDEREQVDDSKVVANISDNETTPESMTYVVDYEIVNRKVGRKWKTGKKVETSGLSLYGETAAGLDETNTPSLYLKMLALASASAENKNHQQPLKVTYITQHDMSNLTRQKANNVKRKAGAAEPESKHGGIKLPATNLSTISEEMSSTDKVSSMQVTPAATLEDADIARRDNVISDDYMYRDDDKLVVVVPPIGDLSAEKECEYTVRGDVVPAEPEPVESVVTVPAKEDKTSSLDDEQNVQNVIDEKPRRKIFALNLKGRGNSKKDVQELPQLPPEVVTYIVEHDMNELTASNRRRYDDVLLSLRLGKKYEVGKKEVEAAKKSEAAAKVASTSFSGDVTVEAVVTTDLRQAPSSSEQQADRLPERASWEPEDFSANPTATVIYQSAAEERDVRSRVFNENNVNYCDPEPVLVPLSCTEPIQVPEDRKNNQLYLEGVGDLDPQHPTINTHREQYDVVRDGNDAYNVNEESSSNENEADDILDSREVSTEAKVQSKNMSSSKRKLPTVFRSSKTEPSRGSSATAKIEAASAQPPYAAVMTSRDEYLHSELSTPTSGFSDATVTYIAEPDSSPTLTLRSRPQISPMSVTLSDSPDVSASVSRAASMSPSAVVTVNRHDSGFGQELMTSKRKSTTNTASGQSNTSSSGSEQQRQGDDAVEEQSWSAALSLQSQPQVVSTLPELADSSEPSASRAATVRSSVVADERSDIDFEQEVKISDDRPLAAFNEVNEVTGGTAVESRAQLSVYQQQAEKSETETDTEKVTYVVNHEQVSSAPPTKRSPFRWRIFKRENKNKASKRSASEGRIKADVIVPVEMSAGLQAAAPTSIGRSHDQKADAQLNRVLLMRPLDDEDIVDRRFSGDVNFDGLVKFPLPADVASSRHFVVVAIDFGTTFSGYAYSFISDVTTKDGGALAVDTIHVMRRWEGGDPGVVNHKAPTALLMTPLGEFHSFGFTARDFYHDLTPRQAKKWLYFDKFKMALHNEADVNVDTELTACNGTRVKALTIFSSALSFFRNHALQEISDQSATLIEPDDVRWVVTVPAIWSDRAKQFMRTAAYEAGVGSPDNPDQLVISLEPEAASIYVRRLHLHQILPDGPLMERPRTPRSRSSVSPDRNRILLSAPASRATSRPTSPTGELRFPTPSRPESLTPSARSPTPSFHWSYHRCSEVPVYSESTVAEQTDLPGTRYMVVDCGGGTVDITVHQLDPVSNKLEEIHKAVGGPFGSIGVDLAFERLLIEVFGADFIDAFKAKRPAGWVDLMLAFESRKRAATPLKTRPLNVSLPFSFIDYHLKYKNFPVDYAVRRHRSREVQWSPQGMLRLFPGAMRRLFQPTLTNIKTAIGNVLNQPACKDIKFMFLVGGFSESQVLQMEIRNEFQHIMKVIIPVEVSLAILKGAVCFGADSSVITSRRSRFTYGIGVVRPFVKGRDPAAKRLRRDGSEWCTDVFDVLVYVDQQVHLGETVSRRYTPVSLPPRSGTTSAVFDVYRSDSADVRFTTDSGVSKCGTLCLDIDGGREVRVQMTFGGTEVKVAAIDVDSGKSAQVRIDFLSCS